MVYQGLQIYNLWEYNSTAAKLYRFSRTSQAYHQDGYFFFYRQLIIKSLNQRKHPFADHLKSPALRSAKKRMGSLLARRVSSTNKFACTSFLHANTYSLSTGPLRRKNSFSSFSALSYRDYSNEAIQDSTSDSSLLPRNTPGADVPAPELVTMAQEMIQDVFNMTPNSHCQPTTKSSSAPSPSGPPSAS